MTMIAEDIYERCVLCLKIGKNSWEHIIPRSFGGGLAAKTLCKECNEKHGQQVIANARKDPTIQVAAHILEEKIPELKKHLIEGTKYFGKNDRGEIVQILVKNGLGKVFTKINEEGELNLDETAVPGFIKDLTKKQNFPADEMESIVDGAKNLPVGDVLPIPGTKKSLKKFVLPKMHIDINAPIMSELVPANIAFQFLAISIGREIFSAKFDVARNELKRLTLEKSVTVTRGSMQRIEPTYELYAKNVGDRIQVMVSFFKNLAFKIIFNVDFRLAKEYFYRDFLELKTRVICERDSESIAWDFENSFVERY